MSSDWEYFCQIHGGSVDDPEFLDKWLEGEEKAQVIDDEECANKYGISVNELYQVERYIFIFKSCSFTQHWQVNNYISKNNLWSEFDNIRSFNDHGANMHIRGILPKFFSLVCEILEINSSNGEPLTRSQRY